MKVVSIINHKGGVGKTTLTANLGAGLAARGKKVLLLDLDSQASLTISFFTQNEWADDLLPTKTIKHWYDDVEQRRGHGQPRASWSPRRSGCNRRLRHGTGVVRHHRRAPGPVGARHRAGQPSSRRTRRSSPMLHGRLRTALAHKALAEYDVVLIDCAPNFGLIAKNAVAASDMLLIPTKPDYLSTNGIDSLGLKIRTFTEEYNDRRNGSGLIERPPAAVIFTMVQNSDGKPDRDPAQRDQPDRGARGADVLHHHPGQQVGVRAGARARRAGDPGGHRPGADPRATRPGLGADHPAGPDRRVTGSATRAAALAQLTALLDELTPAQLNDLVAGRGRLVFRPAGGARPRRPEPEPVAGTDVSSAVVEINRLTSPGEVAGYLERQRFTVSMLREIARALGPTVSTAGRSKGELTRNIVEGTAGFRVRSTAMSGGAWP